MDYEFYSLYSGTSDEYDFYHTLWLDCYDDVRSYENYYVYLMVGFWVPDYENWDFFRCISTLPYYNLYDTVDYGPYLYMDSDGN